MTREVWNGDEWQTHCCGLLSLTYREDIQMVPDRKNGDHGLEAFRLDDGVVYQCYATEDAFTVAAQTESQKVKIRTDIAKLVKNEIELMKMIGDEYRIRRWVLLTPDYDDKELLKYAKYKSKKTLNTIPRPKWCHDDFHIVIKKDTELFPDEIAKLYANSSAIPLDITIPDANTIADRVDNSEFTQLREKLRVHPVLREDSDGLDELVRSMMLGYVYGKDHLEQIEQHYAFAYDKIRQRAFLTLSSLQRRIATGVIDGETEEELIHQLSSAFHADQPALSLVACNAIARHYFSQWWIECPMRYREVS